MTEPTNSDDRINDNADFRSGYCEGFLDAVQLKQDVSPESAAIAARLAARRDELTEEAKAAILDMFGGDRTACPVDWCTYDHRTDDERDDLVQHLGDNNADSIVRRLLVVDEGSKVDIRLARTDCPSEGTVGVPNLYVRVEAELTTWEQAAELARTILDSFGYLGNVDA